MPDDDPTRDDPGARRDASSPTPPRRTTDLGLLVVGAFVVFALVVGGLLAWVSLTGHATTCGLQAAGITSAISDDVAKSPVFQTGGKDCAYWLDRVGHELVAYKVTDPRLSDCPLDWKGRRNTYVLCGQAVTRDQLGRYPTWDAWQDSIQTLLVDLRPQTCRRYELGIRSRIEARLTSEGTARILVPGCTEMWIVLDPVTLHVAAIDATKTDCRLGRNAKGDLTCDGKKANLARLPHHPVRETPNGDVVVDGTRDISV
jgi:hypothetical protein